MPSLFADTHNVVAILEKSDASEGFAQIIDFLTVVKRSGDVTRLQALVDKKKIVISEDVIHEIIRLDDAEGVVCLPNEEIFAGLAQMGYEKPSTKLTFYKAFFSSQWKFLIHTILQSLSAKRTSWNEFSTAMDSAVICLSKGQRFNFSKYIFDSLVRNVDSSSKFYMYPRVETPLFKNMLADREVDAEEEVQVPTQDDVAQENVIEEIVDDVAQPTSPLPPSPVKSSKLGRLKKVGTSQRIESSEDEENVFNQERISVDIDEGIELVDDHEKDAQVKGRQADTQAKIYNIDLDHTSKVLSMQEDTEVQEVVEVVNAAKLMTEVVTVAATQVVAASTPIPAAKPKVLKIAAAAPAVSTKKRKGVIIRDPKEELHNDTPAETLSVKDKGKGILVEDPKPMKKKDPIEMDAEYARKFQEEEESHVQAKDVQAKDVQAKGIQYIRRYHGYKKKPQSESKARKNIIDYLKNTEGFKMAFFKGKTYDQIRPIFQASFGIRHWSSAQVTLLGVVCLPNEEIFTGLAQMGYEKPSTKLTFYKAFFSSQWKFLIHTILQSLSAKRTSWNEFSTAMAFAVFANMKRVRKGFLGVETPLFENMLEVREVDAEEEVQVPAQDVVVQENVTKEIADDVAQPTSPLPPSPVIPSSPPYQSPRPPLSQAAESSSLLVQQVLDKCSVLVLRVKGLETANTAQQLEILKLKARVKKLERLNKVKSSKLRHLKKVGTSHRIESSEDLENVVNQERMNVDIDEGIELVVPAAKPAVVAVSTPISAAKPAAKPKVLKIVPTAPAVLTRKRKGVVIRDPEEELHKDTLGETLSVKDKGKGILVEDPKPMKKKDQIEMDAEYARKLQEKEESHVQAKDVQAKGIQYIRRYHRYKKKPQSKSEACKNMIAYLKNTKEMEKEEEEVIKSKNETPAQKAVKRRRLRKQAKEDENLKKQLEVVVDEDDDVFIEATLTGTKVPGVNYEIVMINNKPRYKIIRADDTHQLYTSFITLLKNFDREDLEDLWKIVKARFSTSKPTNFFNDYLLVTLETMFEKTDAQDVIWRSQPTKHGQALVKNTQAEIYNIDLDHCYKVLSMQEDDAEVQEAVEIVTNAKLMTEVVTVATTQVVPAAKPAVVAVSTPICAAKPATKPKVLKIVLAAPAVSTRKRKGVVIRDPEEELHDDTPDGTLFVKDKGKGILVKDAKPMKKKDQIEMDAEYARKLQEKEESHVQAKDVQAKDAKEDENLKKQLEVVVDEDDDVFIEATPIGTKVPVVNYEIVMINNKPRYKIIRADNNHQLYTSFITLLKNFDRENLEDLWKIMKVRFSTYKPTNFSNDYLLVTLKIMFKKTDAQDVIWRSQHTEHEQALVKSWKLLTSCSMHIITFTTTMFALLVEKKYPFSRLELKLFRDAAAAAHMK
nr:synaptobrevin, longin-like domain protein [Tanacetum cinerariifolium]